MLKDHQDAYGYEIYDYYQGETDLVEIVEREDGYISFSAGPSFYFQTYDYWHQAEKTALEYVQGRVLDLGCGAGRIALHLQEAGHPVLGIDISPKAIEVCRLRGLRNAENLSITQVSSRLGIFDTIMMMGNNFGLFANPKRAKWLLRRFHSMTSPKARIIASTNDVYATDDPDHLAYHQMNLARGRMPGQIRIRIRHKKRKSPWFDYLMVSREELAQILESTGWQIAHIINTEKPQYIAILDKVV
jgi:2-polyprenyl-3-methyl-5-hydroxy-6-metoxy-1,4-benzoquinol methylase